MTYTGLELFMEKLRQLIYKNDNPLICSYQLIFSERPQFQLLYEELGSMIQTLFVEKENDLHELDEVKSLKKRFKEVAEEAHDIVDQFVSDIILESKRLPRRSADFESVLNLQDIMRSIVSIKEELVSIPAKMKMDSSPKTDRLKTQCAAAGGTSVTTNSLRSKNIRNEIIVGLDHDAELIRDKIVEDQKQLDVVSIVGMGGLGKTTLATKVFDDPFVVYHFHVRAWVTVSQTYKKHDLLIQIMESIGFKLDRCTKDNYSLLREMLHKSLMGKRYLIVIDDVWSTKAWDDLKLFFPNNNTGSRLLLTSRIEKVAYHARPDGFIHQLPYLTNDESWELLRKKVFHGNDCPEPLIKSGMKIANNCHGLPLALALIAGVLTKEEVSKDSWQRIARSVTSYIFSDNNWYIETLAMSFDHLPSHLRDCFLYLGGFPEDYKFKPRRLIWLWMAEGFIQETGNQSLEETAEDYLMELVDRNLVIVQDRKFNGAIKTFSVHDVLRELCLEIATKEKFYLKVPETSQGFDPLEVAPYKKHRIFANHNLSITNTSSIRSFLSFYSYPATNYRIIKFSHSWMLLMVLDLSNSKLDYITGVISLLVHLRYLAIWYDGDFPSSICNLWSLQTLIVRRATCLKQLVLPKTISNLVNLRHLCCDTDILFPQIWKPMNLLTIFKVILRDGAKRFVKCVPGVKRLTCSVHQDMQYDFKSLMFLEKLKIGRSYLDTSMEFNNIIPRSQKNSISFPSSLKKLTLEECHLPWSCMSEIQSLPKLEVLKLLRRAFVGPLWDVGEEPFQQLKFLELRELDIKQWEAYSINFPCLKQLVLVQCHNLEEIPQEIGYIPTLERIIIEIYTGYDLFWVDRIQVPIVNCIDIIQEEQHANGNFDLKITVYNSWFNNYHSNLKPMNLLDFEYPGVSINRIASHHLETLGVPINRHLLFQQANIRTCRRRIWNERRSKRRLFKRRF